jgi:hypothetical protein
VAETLLVTVREPVVAADAAGAAVIAVDGVVTGADAEDVDRGVV